MKFDITKFIIITILLFSCLFSNAQNLVPNNSFENYTSCPNGLNRMDLIPPWSIVVNTGSTDYFNSCSNDPPCDMPNNHFGYQPTFSGLGYCGMFCFGQNREYLTGPLTSSLIGNASYRIGFYVNLSNKSRYAIDRLGAFLSIGKVSSVLALTPQIENSSGVFISDTMNWTLISGNYIANGGENYITIGNFQDDSTTLLKSVKDPPGIQSYYYIDEVFAIPSLQIIGNDICLGDSVTLLGTHDSFYSWVDSLNPNSILSVDSFLTVAPTVTTTYLLYGNIDTVSFTVNVNMIPTTNLGNDTDVCQGDTLLLDATYENAAYQWQDGSSNSTYNVITPGKYWVETNSKGCIASDTVLVTHDSIKLDLGKDTTLCQGQLIVLDVSLPNAAYQWQNGSSSSTYSITTPGEYWVEISANGCSVSDSILVSLNSVQLNLGRDTTLCQGELIVLDVSLPNSTYRWQDSSSTSTYSINSSGEYWVEIDSNKCKVSDTILVSYYDSIQLDLGEDTILCQGQSIILDIALPNATYKWQDNSHNATYEVIDTGTYFVIINTNCGITSDTITVGMEDCECQIYIPNSFTPNNDGLNDYFIPNFNCDFSSYNLKIFDRWGLKVFETADPYIGWDGNLQNKNNSIGSFVYVLNYEWAMGFGEQLVGTVTLIR